MSLDACHDGGAIPRFGGRCIDRFREGGTDSVSEFFDVRHNLLVREVQAVNILHMRLDGLEYGFPKLTVDNHVTVGDISTLESISFVLHTILCERSTHKVYTTVCAVDQAIYWPTNVLQTGSSVAVLSVLAGVITALFSVWFSFFVRNQRDLFKSLRAVQTEIETNTDFMGNLSELLQNDLQRQQVDLPIEVYSGTTLEIRYVISFPSSLSTAAYEQLKQSGMFLQLSPDIRRSLFDLYDTIDRINRLRRHREHLHFNHVENVHIIIDPSDLDLAPGEKAQEEDLPAETRQRLEDLRRMRRGLEGINTAALRLIASICPPSMVESRELERFLDSEPRHTVRSASTRDRSASETTNVEAVLSTLRTFERQSLWSRFV